MYFVYILRCKDDSLYTGITTNIERRLAEHCSKKLGAKYTRSRGVKKLEYVLAVENKSIASHFEYKIKQLSRPNKERLIELDLKSAEDVEIFLSEQSS